MTIQQDIHWEKRMGDYLDERLRELKEQNLVKLREWNTKSAALTDREVYRIRADVFMECAAYLEMKAESTISEMAGGMIMAAGVFREFAAVEIAKTA